MTNSAVLEIRAGSRLWFDGEAWSVCQVDVTTVRLHNGDGAYRTVTVAELIDNASPADSGPTADPVGLALPRNVAWSSLSSKKQSSLEKEVTVFTGLLEVSAPDEQARAVRRAADDLGVSIRTVQRRLRRFQHLGPEGLIDERCLQDTRRSVDPRWDEACVAILHEYVNRSTPSKQTVISRATRAFLREVPDGKPPTRAVAYRRVDELDAGKYTFSDAPRRRSVAKRPQGVLGQLRASRPGEYVLMDGYKLDVFAMEPVTMRWVNTELTVAMDLYDRSIKGIRLRPVAAKSADIAGVLLQCMTPQQWGRSSSAASGPYAGVPEHVILGSAGVLPDTIVIDHGKVYMSEHTLGACRRLGISVQPAIPDKPTDKPVLERFFRTLRLSLLDKLSGYKGPNIASRGKDVEKGAFYYVTELEQLIREWVGEVYHVKAHKGLRDPRLPDVDLSPQEMFNRGIAVSGLLRLPAQEDLRYELMDVEWRMIHHYGVDINNRRYDGPALNPYRDRRSHYGGAYAGKWPFMVDVDDIRQVYFQDPTDMTWHPLEWRLADAIDAPFSADAANYTRWLSVQEQRQVDPQQAVEDLLTRWSREEVLGRRERNLAIRLASMAGTQEVVAGAEPRERASLPGVIDLLSRRRANARNHPDDVDDVFARYYAAQPDAGGFDLLDD